MTTEELIELRKLILRGNPPYTIDHMGQKRREIGVRGLDELRAIGDFGPHATGVIMALETHIKLIDHLLTQTKTDDEPEAF